jgi:hypothetical protein
MANDVKAMLDSIINNTDNSYAKKGDKGPAIKKDTVGATVTQNTYPVTTFDSGKFKEKLSLYVLHDLVDAMMADDTEGLDEMVDKSIMKHINDNYDGSCYGYLCAARDRLKSPILAGVVQEVDDITEETSEELEENKDDDTLAGQINIQLLLKDVTDYDTFRDKLKNAVSKKVVDDVYGVVTKRNDAPVFDDLDEELEKQDKDEVQEKAEANEEDVTEESVIMRLTGAIVTEHAIAKDPISTDEGMDQAIVEYCLHELDMCFKAKPKTSFWQSHKF